MNNKLLYVLVFSLMLMISVDSYAQLNINNAVITIESGAVAVPLHVLKQFVFVEFTAVTVALRAI